MIGADKTNGSQLRDFELLVGLTGEVLLRGILGAGATFARPSRLLWRHAPIQVIRHWAGADPLL